MEAMRLHRIIEKDGELLITDLPCKKGQRVEIIVLAEPPTLPQPPQLTAKRLLESDIVGLWQDREDVTDSAVFARQLREEAQRRQR
jgi:predicted nucleic acid-binding protein